jgi:hypothetical protein
MQLRTHGSEKQYHTQTVHTEKKRNRKGEMKREREREREREKERTRGRIREVKRNTRDATPPLVAFDDFTHGALATKDERRKTKDERRKTKDERQKTKDERRGACRLRET